MWRWTALVYLLIFYGHISSQPVSDDTDNGRRSRQLDFGECCPCPGADHTAPIFREQEFQSSNGEFSRARDFDDCPCRPREADSEGAASVFFPTSMRANGLVVRPSEKKEDLKPLLHPEVDLASSVLQTLREATDEEYKDALARDAARSIAKAAEETIFGDATPEASKSVVTIIVNPKHADSDNDVIPQESRTQESHFIHPPLQNTRSNLGKLQYIQKHSNLLREIFELPKKSKPVSLLHRNLLDMDNGMRAGNIEERVVPVDDYQNEIKGKQSLRSFTPIMKLDSNVKSNPLTAKSSSFLDDNRDTNKLSFLRNKPKDLSTRSSLDGGESKVNNLPLIPKRKFDKSFIKTREEINEDLNFSPSTIQEKIAGKSPYFKPKSHLENILDKTGPLSLKTLLKLKDVELLPLKDIVSKSTERPKLFPDILKKENNFISNDKNAAKQSEDKESLEISPTSSQIFEPEFSPSSIFRQITDTNCDNTANPKDVEDKPSNEVLDSAPDSSNIQLVSNDKGVEAVDSHSNELTDTTDCGIVPVTDANIPRSTVKFLNDEIKVANEVDEISKEVDSDCPDNNNSLDAVTDSSNKHNVIFDPSLANKDTESTEEISSQEEKAVHNLNTFHRNTEKKIVDPLSLHQTLSSIKENLRKKLDKFKNPEKVSRDSEEFEQKRSSSNNMENKILPNSIEENLDTNCQNEEPFLVTSVAPETYSLENSKESSREVSMQDLQKISDSMLQQEEEKRESEALKCNNFSNEVDESIITTPISRKIESIDLETSADSENLNDLENPNVPENATDTENDSNLDNGADSENATSLENIVHSENFIDPENASNSQFATDSENRIDLENAADTLNKMVINQPTFVDSSDKSVENACQSDLIFQKQTLAEQTDANAEASEVSISKLPHSRKSLGTKFEIVQPKEDDNDFLRSPLPGINDVLKLPPLPTLEDMKLGLTDLFDKSAGDAKELLSTDANSMTIPSNDLNPTMETDASIANFRSRPFGLKDIDLDILKLKTKSDLLSISKLGKAKLTLPKDLKPLNLQTALGNRGNILGTTLGRPIIPKLDDLKLRTNTDKLFSTPLKSDFLDGLSPSQGLSDISDNLHSHAKKSWRNMQRTLESTFKEATKLPTKLQSNDLLETISQNHEDVSDKLRALHIDLNDRIDTMRNSLADKFISTESRKSKGNFGIHKTKTSQPKATRLIKDRPKKISIARKHEPQRIGKGSKSLTQKQFRMPTAASVPVPKTIDVPQLKTTQTKSPGLTIQKTPDFHSNIRNKEVPANEISSVPLWKQASQKPLGGRISPFKDSKIKVTFSTTPRPPIVPRQQSRTFTQNQGRFMPRDSNGAPTEMKHTITSPPISPIDVNSDTESRSEQTGRQYTNASPPRYIAAKTATKDNADLETQPRTNSDLQSWPKTSESAFLTKVKEAMKARLSKVDSPSKLRRINGPQTEARNVFVENKKVPLYNSEMSQSASENRNVIEAQPLKENVSYKCTMVCTQE